MHCHWPVCLACSIGPFDYVPALPVAVRRFYEAERTIYRGVAFNGWGRGGRGCGVGQMGLRGLPTVYDAPVRVAPDYTHAHAPRNKKPRH